MYVLRLFEIDGIDAKLSLKKQGVFKKFLKQIKIPVGPGSGTSAICAESTWRGP